MISATYPTEPGFKADGPSAQAAAEVKSEAANIRQKCLDLLLNADLTADEAAELLGLSVLSIRPRFSELVMRRLIRDSGLRRENASGKSATVWTTRPEMKLATVQPDLFQKI